MEIYTAIDIKLLGELDPKYGQTYFGSVEELDTPVKFNLAKQVDVMPGRKILAQESEERTSAKGNDYLQLRKVKLSEDGAPVQTELTKDSPSEETPAYEAGTNARWAIGMAYRAYQQVMGTPEDAAGDFPFDAVKLHAINLVQMFDEVKNPSGYDKAKATRARLPDPEEEEDAGY